MTGDELRRIRTEELGLTQAQLAALLGASPNTIARWERDEVRFPYPQMLRLALERIADQ